MISHHLFQHNETETTTIILQRRTEGKNGRLRENGSEPEGNDTEAVTEKEKQKEESKKNS